MTLACLQRVITSLLLLSALCWALIAVSLGAPAVAAVAGVVLILGGHAIVLALEFIPMAFINRRQGEPRATYRQLVRAWCGEVLAAPRVFCWRQPFRGQAWPDRLPERAPGRRGLLLVHGFVCNRGLWNPSLQALTQQGTPFVAVNLEPLFGSIDNYRGALEAAVSRLEQCTGQAPLVIAHSMGGLAVRRWRAEPGNAARLCHVLTIGTPHQGTWLARFGLSSNGREMRRDSPWLGTLRTLESASVGSDYAGFTCFWGHCDNIVFPASTAQLPGADNRHITATAHVHMAEHPEVWAAAMMWLDTP